jgi:hypothetical protein
MPNISGFPPPKIGKSEISFFPWDSFQAFSVGRARKVDK